jgi:LacI family transcriptional regulator
MTGREATLKDIVAETGIPLNTVSRILAGRIVRIGAKTRRRIEVVQEAARRLGYRPHVGARTMRSGRHGCIALISGTDRRGTFLPSELLDGIQERLEAAGLVLHLFRMAEDRLTDPGYLPDAMLNRSCDGVLINHLIRLPEDLVRRIGSANLPAIWINHDGPQVGARPDDRAAGRMAAQVLLDAGHRRIAFAAGFPLDGMQHGSTAERLAGVREACRRRATVRVVAPTVKPPDRDAGAFWDAVLADRVSRPSGVVCYSSSDALYLAWAAQRAGLAVPADLSIAAIGELSTFRVYPVDPTTVLLPWQQVGHAAVDLLVARIAGRQAASIAAMPTLHPGSTIACPRACRSPS